MVQNLSLKSGSGSNDYLRVKVELQSTSGIKKSSLSRV